MFRFHRHTTHTVSQITFPNGWTVSTNIQRQPSEGFITSQVQEIEVAVFHNDSDIWVVPHTGELARDPAISFLSPLDYLKVLNSVSSWDDKVLQTMKELKAHREEQARKELEEVVDVNSLCRRCVKNPRRHPLSDLCDDCYWEEKKNDDWESNQAQDTEREGD